MGRSGLSGNWSYSYDDAGRLTGQSNPFSETTSYTLDNDGRVTLQTHGNGTKVIPSYDADRGWLTGLTHKKSDNTVLADYSYSRNNAGIITAESQASLYSVSYGYDNAYQLTSETRTGTAAYDYDYTYDAVGNRLTKYDGTTTESYTYDDADKLTAAGSKSYGYDNAGNLTSVTVGGNTTTLAWDYAGRLSGITYPSTATNSFNYNDLGQRTSKTDSGGTSATLFNGSRVLADSRADYTTGGLTGLISERASGTTLYNHGDQLGSTRGQTNSAESVTASRERDAWGNVVASTETLAGPFGYAGGATYRQDTDSGLVLLGARYYDPSVGRFISRDPLRYCGGDPNIYRYCSNAPTRFTDPLGMALGWGTVLGAVVALATVSILVGGAPVTVPVAVGVAVLGGMFGSAVLDRTDPANTVLQGAEVAVCAYTGAEIGNALTHVLPTGPGKCFPAGTLVHTKLGLKPIEQIKAGDTVLSRNTDTGRNSYQSVEKKFTRQSKEMVTISLRDGEKIEATPEHPFWVDGKGFVEAKLLRAGDRLSTKDRATGVVAWTSIRRGAFLVYNFRVSTNHTYYVAKRGWLVHNANYGPPGILEKPSDVYSLKQHGGDAHFEAILGLADDALSNGYPVQVNRGNPFRPDLTIYSPDKSHILHTIEVTDTAQPSFMKTGWLDQNRPGWENFKL